MIQRHEENSSAKSMDWHSMDEMFNTESNQFDMVVFVDNGISTNASKHNATIKNWTKKSQCKSYG